MHNRRFLALAFYPERKSDHSRMIAFQLTCASKAMSSTCLTSVEWWYICRVCRIDRCGGCRWYLNTRGFRRVKREGELSILSREQHFPG